MKSLVMATVGVVSLAAASCKSSTSPSPPVFDTRACLERSGPLVVLTDSQGPYHETALADSAIIDARGAVWFDQGNEPVVFTGSRACWSGGNIEGTFADTTSYSAMHDTYGILVYGPNAVIEGVRMHNYGDGISFNAEEAADWTIRGSHFSFLRDDCIENDFLNNGLVDDAFYDGCYVGYSARTYGGFQKDGSSRVVTIQNTLMRLQLMPTVYTGPVPGHAPFFKLDRAGLSPRMVLRNNIFRVDELPTFGSPSSGMYLIPPPEKLADCSNNIIVWLAPEDFPEPLPSCYTLTRDRSVWDAAVAHWLAAHPDLP